MSFPDDPTEVHQPIDLPLRQRGFQHFTRSPHRRAPWIICGILLITTAGIGLIVHQSKPPLTVPRSSPAPKQSVCASTAAYHTAVAADRPRFQLGFDVVPLATDRITAADLGAPGPGRSGCLGDRSLRFTSTGGALVINGEIDNPVTFTIELWFRSVSLHGGKLFGFGDSAQPGPQNLSGQYDRHFYLTDSGEIVFGAYPGEVRVIRSTPGYTDGRWHHVAGSLGGAGMVLSVDGAVVATDPAVTTAQAYRGVWRLGGDNLTGWPDPPQSVFFNGYLDDVVVYDRQLPAERISEHVAATRRE
jgi:hypothetical protein